MENEPQSWYMFGECDSCTSVYVINNYNSHLFVWSGQPEVNRLRSKCTTCGHANSQYISEETADYAIADGMNTHVNPDTAPKSIYDGWLEAIGVKLIPERTLTPREENYVARQEAWADYQLDNNLFDFTNNSEPL